MPSFAKSVIQVSIIGDAKKLIAATQQADKATGGLVSSGARAVVGGLVALRAAGEVNEFLQDSLSEADRLNDAIANLGFQIGDLSGPLIETADNFADLGQSKQDIIEMEARFADLATTAGVADPAIAAMAESAAATAAAMALLGDQDPATLLDLIAKSAGGSARTARELGVTLLENVDPATQLTNILAQLKPKLDAATTGTKDLEQMQAGLDARVETLQASLGEKLAPALADVLQFINDEIDAIPHAIEGFQMLGRVVEDAGRTMLGPLGNVADVLRGIIGLLGDVGRNFGNLTQQGFVGLSEREVTFAERRAAERNGLASRQGGP